MCMEKSNISKLIYYSNKYVMLIKYVCNQFFKCYTETFDYFIYSCICMCVYCSYSMFWTWID